MVAPERLLAQWNEECWVRGHLKSVTGIFEILQKMNWIMNLRKLTLVRPLDLLKRDPEDECIHCVKSRKI